MVNYLEKVFCIEVLEKISRMRRFLSAVPNISHHHNNEIISIYIKALDATALNLKPIITRLSECIGLDEWERLAIVRRLSDVFKRLRR